MATVDIPRQQKAAVKAGSGKEATAPIQQVDVPSPGPGEILVKINWWVWATNVVVWADVRVAGLASAPPTSLCCMTNGPHSAWT